jgi:hypothetical protein
MDHRKDDVYGQNLLLMYHHLSAHEIRLAKFHVEELEGTIQWNHQVTSNDGSLH